MVFEVDNEDDDGGSGGARIFIIRSDSTSMYITENKI